MESLAYQAPVHGTTRSYQERLSTRQKAQGFHHKYQWSPPWSYPPLIFDNTPKNAVMERVDRSIDMAIYYGGHDHFSYISTYMIDKMISTVLYPNDTIESLLRNPLPVVREYETYCDLTEIKNP